MNISIRCKIFSIYLKLVYSLIANIIYIIFYVFLNNIIH